MFVQYIIMEKLIMVLVIQFTWNTVPAELQNTPSFPHITYICCYKLNEERAW